MVGKKKQSIPYEQIVEGVVDKIISIVPTVMIYRQTIMTELIRQKYLDPTIPRKEVKRTYTLAIVNNCDYFKDDNNYLWNEYNEIVGTAHLNNDHNYEYILFSDVGKQNDTITNTFTLINKINNQLQTNII
jgi:hypothetical protein